MAAKSRWERRGFTLIEIIIVLLVLSLATMLVLPDLQPALESTRRNAALRKIAAYFDNVRYRAVASGKTLVLVHDGEENLFVVSEEGPEGPRVDSLEVPEDVEVVETDPESVRYYPQGHSSGIIMTVRYGRERTFRVEVGSFTGLSTVTEAG